MNLDLAWVFCRLAHICYLLAKSMHGSVWARLLAGAPSLGTPFELCEAESWHVCSLGMHDLAKDAARASMPTHAADACLLEPASHVAALLRQMQACASAKEAQSRVTLPTLPTDEEDTRVLQ